MGGAQGGTSCGIAILRKNVSQHLRVLFLAQGSRVIYRHEGRDDLIQLARRGIGARERLGKSSSGERRRGATLQSGTVADGASGAEHLRTGLCLCLSIVAGA